MEESRREAIQPENTVFQENTDLNNFFSGGGRGEALEGLRDAFLRGVPLLMVTGAEGSGKTMMCKALARDVRESCPVVFFPSTVESFDDVVGTIAVELGLIARRELDGIAPDVIVGQMVEYLRGAGHKVFVIFDEAENLYLATLERIRKLLDRVVGEGGHMQLMFSGRTPFLENCDQLTICNFTVNEEFHIELKPMEAADVEGYLHFATEKENGTGDRKFLPELIEHIIESGRGNFRMIKILANDALLRKPQVATVSDENTGASGKSKQKRKPKPSLGKPVEFADFLRPYRKYIPHAGVAVAAFLLLVFFMQSGRDNDVVVTTREKARVDTGGQESQTPPGGNLSARGKEVVGETDSNSSSQDRIGNKTEVDVEPAQVEAVKNEQSADGIHSENLVLQDEQVDEDRIAIRPPADGDFNRGETRRALPDESETDGLNPELTRAESVRSSSPEEQPGANESFERITVARAKELTAKNDSDLKFAVEKPLAEQPSVVALHQDKKKIQHPMTSAAETGRAVSGQKNLGGGPVEGGVSAVAEQLYIERFRAGMPWLAGLRDDYYTVQLMVLTARSAERSMKTMLTQKKFRQEAGNFYIFRMGLGEPLFVFYGAYSTLEAARLAQRSLPEFLASSSQPYAISIRDAMAKLRK